MILAAGFVKGTGFADEQAALLAVERGDNIIPGWRTMPALVGQVEFGSFTRWPRLGNPGTVIWRDTTTLSTQNRVGLKNPGAAAAAAFLARHKAAIPPVFGINIAVSPGVSDPAQETQEAVESFDHFFTGGICPAWFTLNISCPNTEDDPGGHQTEERARNLCRAVVNRLADRVPLWVKVSPGLSDEQYMALMRAFAETGVRGVVATNTLARPTLDDARVMAGVGGGRLHEYAVTAASILMREKLKYGYTVDVIGCGGVQDARTYRDFTQLGIQAVQYWSALIYRGPLAAAHILREATHAR
jgi:dihydroorotate dehydrogenase